MADVLGLSDVSSKDTGKGKQLKTGNLKRSYNMPSPKECAKKYKKGSKKYNLCIAYRKVSSPKSKESNPPIAEGRMY